jgi:outer membrane protein insertion porin family
MPQNAPAMPPPLTTSMGPQLAPPPGLTPVHAQGLLPGEEMVVEVRIEGATSISIEKITEKIRTHAGRPYDSEQISKDVRALYTMNRFVSVTPLKQAAPGGCIVIFRLVERPVFRQVIFAGNDNVRSGTLRKEGDIKAGDAADPFTVQNAATKIREYYEREGYASVRVTILEGDKPGDLRAIFLIDEGQRQKIFWVSFVGNTIVSADRLKTQISSRHPYFYLFSGELDHKTVEEDVGKLTAYYRGLGFFKARVGRELEFNPSRTWCTLTFVIDEGPRYSIRNIMVVGNQKLPADKLVENFKLKNGDFFDQGKQTVDLNAIRDEYGSVGYVFAKIDPEIAYLDEPGKVDIVYNIEEGSRYRVGMLKVQIKGDNPHTQLNTVMNRLSVKPGDLADTRKLRDDERRLKASGLYMNDPQKGSVPKIAYSAPDSEAKETAVAEGGPKERTTYYALGDGTRLPPLPQEEKYVDVVYLDSTPDALEPKTYSNPQSGAQLNPQQSWPQNAQPNAGVPCTSYMPTTTSALQTLAPAQVPEQRPVPMPVSPDMPCAPPPDGPVYPMQELLVIRGQNVWTPISQQASYQQPTNPPQTFQQQQSNTNPYAGAQQPAYAQQPNYGQPQNAPPVYGAPQQTIAPQTSYTPVSEYPNPNFVPQPAYSAAPSQQYGQPYGQPAYAQQGPAYAQQGFVQQAPAPQAYTYAPGYVSNPPPQNSNVYSADGMPSPGSPVYADRDIYGNRANPVVQTVGGDIMSDPSPTLFPPYNAGTPFFPSVTGDPLRDLPSTINVEEAQTGRLMFGVGVNSDAGLVGNITLDEQNFDIMRPPTSWDDIVDGRAFRGAGERFRVELAPGVSVQRYMISFQEPYLFDTPISYGVSGFYYERTYTEWTETRAGGRVSLGYQFAPDLQGSLSFQGQHVDIKDPEYPNAAYTAPVPALQSALGYSELYTFGAELRYDKRDSPFLATQGYQLQGTIEETVGTYQYPRVSLTAAKYYTLTERADGSGRQVLSFTAKGGYSGDDTPIFERYYGGGFSSIRGFAFRGVTPRDPGSQMGIGGDFQLFTTAQYMFPITADDMLRGVVFCDAGTIEPKINDWVEKVRVAPGFGLRITIPMMGPAPIALDFAFPIQSQPGDQKQVFSFFVGFGGP